jgi:hypothetical protein
MNAESGNSMERAWCDECGCGIWLKSISNPSQTYFKAGLFEQGEIPNPTMENWMKVSGLFGDIFIVNILLMAFKNMEPWEQPATGTKRQAYDGN